MAIFLLDTNVVSELSKVDPDRRLLARYEVHQTSCALAAPTMEELAYGIERMTPSERRRRLQIWFEQIPENFEFLSYDVHCALWLGGERARLEALGQPVPALDGQIAAVAACNNLTLITRNTADLAGFSGLRVENWFEG